MATPSPPLQISELTSELTDERNTGESASQLLDAEAAERLRAEKEMKELQVRTGLGWRPPCQLPPRSGVHLLPSGNGWPGTPIRPG